MFYSLKIKGINKMQKVYLSVTASGKCGLFTRRLLRKDNRPYATKKDIWYCPSCRNRTNVHRIRIPYAFKLLLQELTAMCIAPRIRVKEDKFNQ